MRYKLLGRTGLRVSELCLGTMTFGPEWGWGADRATSRAMFDAFANAGGNFIDTANFYTGGTSERLVGEFVAEDRERWVVATKYTLATRPDHANGGGNHRKSLVHSLERSLERLDTDYVDLLWVHAWDFVTPEEEVMRALDDLVRAGKVLYIGVSDTPAWMVARCNTLAELRGWTSFAGLQIRYNLTDRAAERDLLPMARALDVAVTPWAPVAAGLLTGKYTRGVETGTSDATGRLTETAWGKGAFGDKQLAIARAVDRVADERGCTSSQVALSWLRQRPGVVIPIIGARSAEHIRDNLGCVDQTLTAEEIATLDEVSAIELGFPHDFLNAPSILGTIHGNKGHLLDDHRGQRPGIPPVPKPVG